MCRISSNILLKDFILSIKFQFTYRMFEVHRRIASWITMHALRSILKETVAQAFDFVSNILDCFFFNFNEFDICEELLVYIYFFSENLSLGKIFSFINSGKHAGIFYFVTIL
ncbi:hypothetical protein HPP92_001477 [Vanilla planifolia]|uniref:Uncharacterized protein n=1 Tax=Vanilla planifolia TaxID=51239 RepID=A0A835S6P6_VANPL|nr:hypothetical protein HPP92_001477 [Vanilla planifolia]